MGQTKIYGDIELDGTFLDSSGDSGTTGQMLSSTGTGTNWIAALYNSISINTYAQFSGRKTNEDVHIASEAKLIG